MAEPDVIHHDDWLSAYLDGELTPAARAEAEQRLAGDPAARRRLDELGLLARELGELPRCEVPDDFVAEVQRRIERQFSTSVAAGAGRLRRGWLPLGMAAAVGLSVLVWFEVRSHAPKPARSIVLVDAVTPTEEFKKQPWAMHADLAPPASEPAVLKESSESRAAAMRETSSDDTGAAWVQRLLTIATLDQKMTAGVDEALLREHWFANEPRQLFLIASDPAVSERVEAVLTSMASDREDKHDESKSAGKLAWKGRPGKNFDPAEGEFQWIVRCPRHEWPVILDRLAAASGESVRIELVSGDVLLSGWTAAQTAIASNAGEQLAFGQPLPELSTSERSVSPGKPDIPIPEEPPKKSLFVDNTLTPEKVIEDLIGMLGRSAVSGSPPAEQPEKAGNVEAQGRSAPETTTVASAGVPVHEELRDSSRARKTETHMQEEEEASSLKRAERQAPESKLSSVSTAHSKAGRRPSPEVEAEAFENRLPLAARRLRSVRGDADTSEKSADGASSPTGSTDLPADEVDSKPALSVMSAEGPKLNDMVGGEAGGGGSGQTETRLGLEFAHSRNQIATEWVTIVVRVYVAPSSARPARAQPATRHDPRNENEHPPQN